MFILALAAAVILGYLVGGNIKNLSTVQLKGAYLILSGFLIEFIINMLITRGYMTSGPITFMMDVIMYSLLFAFVFANRTSLYLMIMGAGFILNAIAIFSNGGSMPVSEYAIQLTRITSDIHKEGLYTLIGDQTKFKVLCDFIPINFIGSFVVSIGDIISAIGMILFIVTAMKSNKQIENKVLKEI